MLAPSIEGCKIFLSKAFHFHNCFSFWGGGGEENKTVFYHARGRVDSILLFFFRSIESEKKKNLFQNRCEWR